MQTVASCYYKPLNFARYTILYGIYLPCPPLGSLGLRNDIISTLFSWFLCDLEDREVYVEF